MIMRMVCLSIQSADANSMREPVEAVCGENGWEVSMFCVNSGDADSDPLTYHEMVARAKEADLVLVRCMSDPNRMKRFGSFEKVLRECPGYVVVNSGNPEVGLMYRDMFKGTDREYAQIIALVRGRGAENDRGIAMWLHHVLTGEGEVPEPKVQRTDGIHHPRFPEDVSLDDYLSSLDPSRPTVAIMYAASLWVYGNQRHIDSLIAEFESNGINVIPVFYTSSASSTIEGGARTIMERYLMRDGRPIVDAVVMATPFSQLNGSREGTGFDIPEEQNFFRTLFDVPVIHAMVLAAHYQDYEECGSGQKGGFNMSLVWPEMDGQIITVPIGSNESGRGGPKMYTPLDGRIRHLVRTVSGWVRLRRKSRAERKVAILLYQPRADSGNIGSAAGLDTLESVCRILARLKEEGYVVDRVPASSGELRDMLVAAETNDNSNSSPARVLETSAGTMTKSEYQTIFDTVPEFDRNGMIGKWGEPPGKVGTEKGRIAFPGIFDGNVFIGYQPMRAPGEGDVTHDPVMPPTHQYLAFYRWMRQIGINAVIHMGTHGTLEWLPGRSMALSDKCYPDIVLDGMPNIYPYTIDDPGEGLQAKRRSEAVLIGHMCPMLVRAGSYDMLERVELPLQEFMKERAAGGTRTEHLAQLAVDAAEEAGMLKDLDIDGGDPVDTAVRLHEYVTDIRDSLIRDGLHILGDAPQGDMLRDTVVSLTMMRNGDVPSLREVVAEHLGLDLKAIRDDPSGSTGGRLNSELLEEIDAGVHSVADILSAHDYDIDGCSDEILDDPKIKGLAQYICNTLVPSLRGISGEMDSLMHALDGGYVLPGPSGAPYRGNAHILPTGRNFYGIDPDIIPTKASWEAGREMADLMVERYVSEKGCYPREVGFIIWATDTVKTGGDDMAYILWLMGIRPIWSPTGGQVIGIEPVPLSELGRPRIDVTVRITGLFRDMFPNLIDMIDDAGRMASEMDESDEDNALAANLRRDIIDGMAEGLTVDEARRRASVRVFGCPPGGYGSGVNHAIESGDWETVKDLADIYIAWGSHAYGRGLAGESMRDMFVRKFSKVGVTVKNLPDREFDVLDVDDFYGYLGGLNSFVRTYGNQDAVSYMGDGSDPERIRVRDTKEELSKVYRSKVLNPRFADGLKRHGYRGAAELADLTEFTLGWGATSDTAEDWMYEGLAERYLFDDQYRQWLEDENPHAMMSVIERLFEASERGLWDAKPETLEKLRRLFLELEERIEEIGDR